jgi:hypothetical protein
MKMITVINDKHLSGKTVCVTKLHDLVRIGFNACCRFQDGLLASPGCHGDTL